MNVNANGLGFRELSRLCSFIQFMVENHPSELIDSTVSYSLKYDMPVINRLFESLYSDDFNVGFNENNVAESLD